MVTLEEAWAQLRSAGEQLLAKAVEEQLARGEALVQRVLDDAGIIVAGVGGLRMTPHVYNTETHIDRMVEAVAGLRDLVSG